MRIFSNTAISLDGRIATLDNAHFFLGSQEDARQMSRLRDQADAILVGGQSFRNWPHPLVPKPQHLGAPPRRGWRWNVVVSRKMDFQFSEAYLKQSGIRSLFFTPLGDVPSSFPFEVVGLRSGSVPEQIIEALAARGVDTLLLESGGDLLFQFLAVDCLQEMYVTLCPRLIGGKGAPSLVDGMGFSLKTLKKLSLLECRVARDEIFLKYGVD